MKDTSTDAKRALRAQAELLAKLRKSRTEKTVDAIMQQLEKEEQKREAKEAKALNRIQKKNSSSSKPASRSKPDSNKKKKVTTKKAKKEIKSIIYDESHEGYSDEEGSVESGILDEKVCCECGIKTDRKKECEELVLCDVCDSEYHMKCVGMERTRTRALVWTCPRCLDEETHFSSLSFLGGQKFQVLAILSFYHSCYYTILSVAK